MSQATAYEQYMLELINRDRAENGGLPPLAFNLDLNDAADGHTQWMLANGVFSHTGANGSDPGTRMTNAGYNFSGTWGWGENIAWVSTSSAGLESDVAQLETNLMNSPPHRANLLNASYTEIGIGIETGSYQGYNAAFVTQDFAYRTENPFLTGVAYDDLNGDKFYDVGEGLANVTVTAVNTATGQSFTTKGNDAGGYQLELAAGTYKVTFSDGGVHAATTATETIGSQNVEADWVDPTLSGGSSTTPPPTTTPSTTASHDFLGAGKSDILLENTKGVTAVGQIGSGGQEAYTSVGALGSEWTFHGSGDFLGDSQDQYLLQNTSGAIYAAEVKNGQAHYTEIGAVGREWSLLSTGDYLADGKSGVLMENTSGALAIAEAGANGQAHFTQLGALGSGWSVKGSGDLLGDGHDQFLLENASGAVFVGDVTSGQAHYTQVAAVGSEWSFKGVGDFLGDGKSQFLIENTKGVLEIGEVGSNGQVAYTQIGAVGSEWSVKGAGDFLSEGHDQVVMQNTSGAVVVADVQKGVAHYTQVGALGSEWTFHM